MILEKIFEPEYEEKELFKITVKKEWQISTARRNLNQLAKAKGFNINQTAELVTSISELAYNLFFHTTDGGEITISTIEDAANTAIKLISRDTGPGIVSIETALQDGYSTNGGLGGGLPGVKRLMDDFSISSTQNGTLISCIKWRS